MKKDPVIAKRWRKNKVVTELLKYGNGRSPFTFQNKQFKLFNVLTYNTCYFVICIIFFQALKIINIYSPQH